MSATTDRLPIETERLRLREWDPGPERFGLAALHCDPNLMRLIPRGPAPSTAVALEQWERRKAEGEISMAVELKPEGLIGEAVLKWDGRTAEIGGVLTRAFWHEGYATEMGEALVALAFRLGALRVIAQTHPWNAAAGQVCTRLGMEYLGHGTFALDAQNRCTCRRKTLQREHHAHDCPYRTGRQTEAEAAAEIETEAIAETLGRYRAALEEIAGQDFRGNRSVEMGIAYRALHPEGR